jgi:hypothetical protein
MDFSRGNCFVVLFNDIVPELSGEITIEQFLGEKFIMF